MLRQYFRAAADPHLDARHLVHQQLERRLHLESDTDYPGRHLHQYAADNCQYPIAVDEARMDERQNLVELNRDVDQT